MTEFLASTPESNYFGGKEYLAQKKWMDNLLKDVDSLKTSNKENSTIEPLAILSKQMHCTTDMCK